MHWNLNYITEIWYKNSYTLKDITCIYKYRLHKYYKYIFLYRKNLFTKEKLNKKEQHNLYTLFTIYRSNIVGKTNQFKHNSLFINLFCLQYYSSHINFIVTTLNYF